MTKGCVLQAVDLKIWFSVRESFASSLVRKASKYLRAVDGVSFAVGSGEILCLVGESGCGKTTIGRAILGTIPLQDGEVTVGETRITYSDKTMVKWLRKQVQMIFQDPYGSLNPSMKVREILTEPLRIHLPPGSKAEEESLVRRALEDCGLAPAEAYLDKKPQELSGGQRQRVAIAATLSVRPKLIIADEPTSMLDASKNVEILNLILKLKEDHGESFLYITHDLASARYVSDRIAVMYLGRIVEVGDSEDVICTPIHPYTHALISVAPVPDPSSKSQQIILPGEIPSPTNVPRGCRFHTRCEYAKATCLESEPELALVHKDHYVACHEAASLPYLDAKQIH